MGMSHTITRISYQLPASHNLQSFTKDLAKDETMPCVVGDTVYADLREGSGEGRVTGRHLILGDTTATILIAVKMDSWKERSGG